MAEAWPRAQKPSERSSIQVVMRALGCIATARVNADDLDPANKYTDCELKVEMKNGNTCNLSSTACNNIIPT